MKINTQLYILLENRYKRLYKSNARIISKVPQIDVGTNIDYYA